MGSIFSKDSSIRTVDERIKRLWNEDNSRTTPDDKSKIGSRFNSWRVPVWEFAPHEVDLAERLQEYSMQYELTEESWQKCCNAVDIISQLFHDYLQKTTSEFYPGVVLKDFIKQGSSREGLKNRYPEFDMILPFTIEGVDILPVTTLESDAKPIPALCKLKVLNPKVLNGHRYQLLRKSGVFEQHGSDMFLNAMCFQNRVMSSLMRITFLKVQEEIDKEAEKEPCVFALSETTHPSVYGFKIKIKSDAGHGDRGERVEIQINNATPNVIELNIIPGFLLKPDYVPDPNSWFFFKSSMECDKYAVMDWIHKGCRSVDYPTPHLLWRESTCGYEKHIIDVSRRTKRFSYILTACRIMKAFIDGLNGSLELRSLLSSYHMKNIAIHCILLQLQVSGVREALGYLMVFLEVCLEKEFLPHFFYGNTYLSNMLSKPSTGDKQKRLNLLKNIPHSYFEEAKCSLKQIKVRLRGLFIESSKLNRQSIQAFTELCSLNTDCENTDNSCKLM